MSRYTINKNDLEFNIEKVKELAGVPVIGVVKGNGYGIGTLNLAKILISHGIKTLAVTEIEDALDLRQNFDCISILILRSTCVKSEAEKIAENDLTATIGSEKSAQVMNEAAKKAGKKVKCHLKVDTGLSRYGFTISQIGEAKECYSLGNLDFEGIYTHFSSAFRNYDLTKKQLGEFLAFKAELEKAGINTGIAHCANSPALLNVEGTALDSVRIGSAFLGRVISPKIGEFKRAGILEAEVVEIKHLPKGTSVGYNGKYITSAQTDIAIVPFGHYDGFGLEKQNEEAQFRSILSSAKKFAQKKRMYVTIKGKKYYVCGEIGLSHTAVDITGSDVKEGDTAQADISPLLVNPKIPRNFI